MSLNNRLSVPKQQHHYYSGKKMPYSQSPTDYLLGEADSIGICRKGKVHDFRILKESRLPINRETEKADGGYQGIDKEKRLS